MRGACVSPEARQSSFCLMIPDKIGAFSCGWWYQTSVPLNEKVAISSSRSGWSAGILIIIMTHWRLHQQSVWERSQTYPQVHSAEHRFRQTPFSALAIAAIFRTKFGGTPMRIPNISSEDNTWANRKNQVPSHETSLLAFREGWRKNG